MLARCAAALALLVLLAGATAGQEVVIGGEASLLPSVTLSPGLPERILPLIRTQYRAQFAAYGERTELRAAVTAWHELPDDAQPSLGAAGAELTTLRLAIYGQWLTVELGRFVHRTGRALLVSPNSPYTTLATSRLLEGDLDALGEPQTMALATVFLPWAYLKAGVVPVPNVPQLAESGSIWIPRLPLDQVIDDPRIAPDPVELDEVYSEPTRRLEELYRRVSAGLEAGATLGAVDLSFLYYHGIDPAPVPRARIDFPRVPVDAYDLYFAPEEAVVDSFGLFTESAAGDATFWLDAAYIPNKGWTNTRVDAFTKRTDLLRIPTVQGVLGATYRFTRPNLLLAAEYYQTWPFVPRSVDPSLLIRPALSWDLAASARLGLGDRTLWTLVAGGIASLDEPGGVISLAVEAALTDAFTIALRAPLFLGPVDSRFGQYRDVIQIAGTVRARL